MILFFHFLYAIYENELSLQLQYESKAYSYMLYTTKYRSVYKWLFNKYISECYAYVYNILMNISSTKELFIIVLSLKSHLCLMDINQVTYIF